MASSFSSSSRKPRDSLLYSFIRIARCSFIRCLSVHWWCPTAGRPNSACSPLSQSPSSSYTISIQSLICDRMCLCIYWCARLLRVYNTSRVVLMKTTSTQRSISRAEQSHRANVSISMITQQTSARHSHTIRRRVATCYAEHTQRTTQHNANTPITISTHTQ